MNIVGVIPARYASTRFPGKPLVMINGKTMIQRVYEQAVLCSALSKVVVATDHDSIEKHVIAFGGHVIMTSETHRSGTERCQEVMERFAAEGVYYDGVINIQGDEPFLNPQQIVEVADCLQQPGTTIATLIKKINSREELDNPNVVKAIINQKGKALYFSRSPIPYVRGKTADKWLDNTVFFKHVGIYGYLSEILKKLVSLPVSPLESAESLEQLRWLENGFQIQTQITAFESASIDTPADLLKITNNR
ncbi:MAG: 3-deoxy-manno-octulosonate cytidylyltransferase [Bacteroidales bacterium]|nr:3-deoxy-manno-octulosonate cytidylyltransferase [Bacteroidales bacterium]